jgi:uncharacterized protein
MAAATALAQFRQDFTHQFRTVDITLTLITRAMDLAETHALRGDDAVQYAAAVIVHTYRQTLQMPLLTMVSADDALNTASAAEGLVVDEPHTHP